MYIVTITSACAVVCLLAPPHIKKGELTKSVNARVMKSQLLRYVQTTPPVGRRPDLRATAEGEIVTMSTSAFQPEFILV